jgi:hypothetical protein
LPKLLKLVARSCSSKLLFLFTYSITVYCYLNNKVNNVARTAYAAVSCNVNVQIEVKAVNKFAVVQGRVIAYKVVELVGYFVVIKDVAYNSSLRSASIVSV